MIKWNLFRLFLLSGVMRVVLVVYGYIQDATMVVKYTDIDYLVFTDAARFMYEGDSPYNRSTYRYSPVLAGILQLNIILHNSIGKLLFCGCDLLIAYMWCVIIKDKLKNPCINKKTKLSIDKLKTLNFKNKKILPSCEDEMKSQSDTKVNYPTHKSTENDRRLMIGLSLWLLNPLSLTVSSRGNAESFILIFITLFFYFLHQAEKSDKNNNDNSTFCRSNKINCKLIKNKNDITNNSGLFINYNLKTYTYLVLAGVMFAFSIHLKIYPITYTLILYLNLNSKRRFIWPKKDNDGKDCFKDKPRVNIMNKGNQFDEVEIKDFEEKKESSKYENNEKEMDKKRIKSDILDINETKVLNENNTASFLWLLLPSKQCLVFGFTSLISLILLTSFFSYHYGMVFLQETYLHHITRKDHRHNFSPYFYLIYLSSIHPPSLFLPLVTFIPQVLLSIVIASKYHNDTHFACFLQTFVFVIFNKVCTSQYFLWFLVFLPCLINKVRMSASRSIFIFLLWLSAQVLWLFCAYWLEMRGINSFLYIWMAGIIFLFVNTFAISSICSGYHSVCHFSNAECGKKENGEKNKYIFKKKI